MVIGHLGNLSPWKKSVVFLSLPFNTDSPFCNADAIFASSIKKCVSSSAGLDPRSGDAGFFGFSGGAGSGPSWTGRSFFSMRTCAHGAVWHAMKHGNKVKARSWEGKDPPSLLWPHLVTVVSLTWNWLLMSSRPDDRDESEQSLSSSYLPLFVGGYGEDLSIRRTRCSWFPREA